MTPHTLPAETDRGNVRPHPQGRAWELADFIDPTNLLDPALAWNQAGVVLIRDAVPDQLIESYRQCWLGSNGPLHRHPDGTVDAPRLGGWRETDYLYHEPVMNLMTYKPVHDVIESLIGEPPCVNLCLTGWVSTQRQLHRDEYLNPECVQDRYAACWLALDDVHPDSGPFVYYPGSHLWPGSLTKDLMGQAVDLADSRWPAYTEEVLSPLLAAEAQHRGVELVVHLPKKGELLIWHGRTVHAGSVPNVPNSYRGAAIWHLSGIEHRPDFPYRPRRWRDQGHYMPYPDAVSPLECM